jgi:hypothetical protein
VSNPKRHGRLRRTIKDEYNMNILYCVLTDLNK